MKKKVEHSVEEKIVYFTQLVLEQDARVVLATVRLNKLKSILKNFEDENYQDFDGELQKQLDSKKA